MADFQDTINSLSLLQRHYGALMDAIPLLQQIDSLENRIKEGEKAVEINKGIVADLLDKQVDARQALEDLEKAQDQRKEEMASWVADQQKATQEAAKALIADAQVQADALIQAAKDKVLQIGAAIEEKQETFQNIQNAIATSQATYEQTLAKIRSLKESL